MTLLESLLRLTRSNYYQVYIVDDCSANAEFLSTIERNANKNSERLNQPKVINTLRTDVHSGFAAACRAGYERGESPYVCFLNSDCVIENAGWLRAMGESLLSLKDSGVRMVSAMTDNTVGGDVAQSGEKFAKEQEDVILESGSFLTLYCFLCHRHLFDRCGGFLKEYPYGSYEDQEFAHRMARHGYKQAVCRRSWVHHEGEATLRPLMRNNPRVVEIIESNRQRCIEDIKKMS
jgi:GT2 family glycosyltransferase